MPWSPPSADLHPVSSELAGEVQATDKHPGKLIWRTQAGQPQGQLSLIHSEDPSYSLGNGWQE